MYRSAVRRLHCKQLIRQFDETRLGYCCLQPNGTVYRFCGSGNTRFISVGDPDGNKAPLVNFVTFEQLSSSKTFSSSSSGDPPTSTAENARTGNSRRPKFAYQNEEARLLQASLSHVLTLGWSEEAMIAGSRDVDLSPSIVGSFPHKEAALVEFFMDECLKKLMERIGSGEGLQNLMPSECISKLIKLRLEMQSPYISKLPQALSIQVHPSNFSSSFRQRAMLIDEICRASSDEDDESSSLDWKWLKCTLIGGVYSTTEIYMLTDTSPDFHDTWTFLGDCVKDLFDLKKTIREAKQLAEIVGVGMEASLLKFVGDL